MQRGLVAFVLSTLVVLSGLAGAGVGAGVAAPDTGAAVTDPGSLAEAQQQFDRTEFRITLYENGSARWTFRYQQTLDNETERTDFGTFAERFNTEETALYTDFVNRSEALTASGSEATGREMAATDFSREAFVNDLGNQGVVEMSFRWDGFARAEGDRVVVGDVFDGGLYIRADQRLVFSHGPELAFAEAAPDPDSVSGGTLADSESVTWSGERSFTDGRPRLVLSPASTTGTPDGGDGGDGGTATSTTGGVNGGSDGGGDGLLGLVGLLVVVILGLGAAYAYRSGALGGETDAGGSGGAGGTAATTSEKDEGSDAAAEAEPEPEPEPAVSDEMLLSDEDRVMKLIEENGGRMKQVNIVDETDWSKSKVSMLLSDMEEDELISKLRVGRENIISKKGMEPEAARSPFEDENGAEDG
jgi:hypothetical protein